MSAIVPPDTRLAVTGVSDGFHARLRGRAGLTAEGPRAEASGIGYAGREFRVYGFMRVGDAARFYASLHERWDEERLYADLAAAGLGERFEVRRMKRAYQRALVLALVLAAKPETLVVESAAEFDEPAARKLLASGIARVSRALVTYDAPSLDAGAATVGCTAEIAYDRVLSAAAYEEAMVYGERGAEAAAG